MEAGASPFISESRQKTRRYLGRSGRRKKRGVGGGGGASTNAESRAGKHSPSPKAPRRCTPRDKDLLATHLGRDPLSFSRSRSHTKLPPRWMVPGLYLTNAAALLRTLPKHVRSHSMVSSMRAHTAVSSSQGWTGRNDKARSLEINRLYLPACLLNEFPARRLEAFLSFHCLRTRRYRKNNRLRRITAVNQRH